MKSPFGARGAKPVYFDVPSRTEAELLHWTGVLSAIPGVEVRKDRVYCTWEAATTVASYLRVLCNVPVPTDLHLPGIERAIALGLKDSLRAYQREGARFAAARPAAYIAFGCRTGKTATVLAGAELASAGRVFVAAPAIAKHGWNQDAWRFLRRSAFMLRGRSGTQARVLCRTCNRTGRLADGSRCPDCRAKNGSSYGWRLYKARKLEVHAGTDGLPSCKEHPEVKGQYGETCHLCLKQFVSEFRKATLVVASYDVLTEHAGRSKRGTAERRMDLPGAGARIESGDFDCAILDELHTRRGRMASSYKAKTGSEVNLRLSQAISKIPQVFGTSATPIFAHTRDLWTQFELLNPGSYGRGRRDFDTRYCSAYQSAFGGWENKGTSVFAETELRERMSHFMLKRTRMELLGPEAPFTCEVMVIEPSKKLAKTKFGVGIGLREQLAATLPHKVDPIVESVLNDVSEGSKCAIFTTTLQNADTLEAAVIKALESRDFRSRADLVRAKVFRGDGRIPGEARADLAEAFVAHEGAAVWVGTTTSAQMGISLAGAVTIHVADIMPSPAELLQLRERPNIVGRKMPLALILYAVEGSIDESIAESLKATLPNLEKVLADGDAKRLREAIGYAEQTVDEAYAAWKLKLADVDVDDLEDD